MSLSPLAGTVVIITGASSGMGECTARALHRASAHPVLVARRRDRLDQLSAELDGALAVTADVTKAADVARIVDETLARFGRIDGLVNNAGKSLGVDVADVNISDFRQVLEPNVVAPVAMLQAVLPSMRATGRGSVVNVSSGTTRRVATGLAPYASTKAALNTLSLAARAELAADGIDVSLVVPFITATEFGNSMFADPDFEIGGHPAHTPEFVAAVILRLLQTGEERIDLLPGPEDWSLAELP